MPGRSVVLALLLLTAATVPATKALASPGVGPSATTGGIGIQLVAAAETPPADPLARNYVVDQLSPGASIRRIIEISNTTHANADVAVYPAAAAIVGGSFQFAPGRTQDALCSWASVRRGILHLAPGTEATDTLTINVPTNAVSGQYYGVVWAQVSSPPPPGGGVTLTNRVGVRMYLSVGLGGALPSNFVIGALTAKRSSTGKPLVATTVHNSGQATLDITGNLMLSNGPGGLSGGPFAVKVGLVLAPGVSEPATVALDSGLPRGPWRADLSLVSGLTKRTAVATITFPSNAATKTPGMKVGLPALLVVIALFVLLGITATALGVSRRRRPKPS